MIRILAFSSLVTDKWKPNLIVRKWAKAKWGFGIEKNMRTRITVKGTKSRKGMYIYYTLWGNLMCLPGKEKETVVFLPVMGQCHYIVRLPFWETETSSFSLLLALQGLPRILFPRSQKPSVHDTHTLSSLTIIKLS